MGGEIHAGRSRREIPPLFIPLLLALFHGLLYVFIIPPWQHYDEPTQFEYAWLIANRPGLPAPGEYDQGMRREVAASMIEHGFFRSLDFRPNLLSQTEPVWIGISQVDDLPLYYLLASLPLRLVKGSDITFQLYVGRFVSLFLYLVTVLSVYGVLVELTPRGHLLRWLVPLCLVLLPGFTDLMTAINNDVGATAFFSLFLWTIVLLLKRGFSWPILVASLVLALACFWTKTTVMFAFTLFAIPAIQLLMPRGVKRLSWIPLLVVFLLGLFLFRRDEAALWYRKGLQLSPVRASQAAAPLGKHVLELVQEPGASPAQLYQLIPGDEVQKLRGGKVTFGAWVWASEPARVQAVGLFDQSDLFTTAIDVGPQPVFFSMSTTLDPKIKKLEILLSPNVADSGKPVNVYYDGLVLVKGKRPIDSVPEFSNQDGRDGVWGGRPFTNLIRNASAESAWLRFHPRVEKYLAAYLPFYTPEIMNVLIDWPGAGQYITMTSRMLLETFWGRFGWAHVAMGGKWTYKMLAIVTLACFLGAMVSVVRRWRSLDKAVLFLMAAALLAVWGTTFLRGVSSLSATILVPSARYAFPAISPTMLLLTTGWLELFHPLRRWKKAGTILPAVAILFFFLALDLLSIWSIQRFYR